MGSNHSVSIKSTNLSWGVSGSIPRHRVAWQNGVWKKTFVLFSYSSECKSKVSANLDCIVGMSELLICDFTKSG